MCVGTLADWLVAVGTLILAAVAVFQETIRSWFYKPKFRVSISTEPPDCIAVPFGPVNGVMIDAYYLRLWVENIGNATALNAEVYADELRRQRADGIWERVTAFPPMNLRWANVHVMYFPNISPQMGKHCDLAHVTHPSGRTTIGEDSPRLVLTNQQTSLAFDLIAPPNHKGHIVGQGEYQLDVRIAAQNAPPIKRTVAISLRGAWYTDEQQMFRDGIGVSIL